MTFFLAVLLSVAGSTPRPLIWEPGGGFHFRQESPRVTTGWLGLYCKSSCSLRPATLEYVRDKRFEELLHAATRPAGASYVFRDVPALTAGPVDVADEDGRSLYTDHDTTLTLKGKRYELRVETRDKFLEQAVVTLHHGGVSQEIYRMPDFVDDPHLYVLFAGDLDRDGKLDLIMNMSWKYSLHPLQLFLSSAARGGELVREVANFERSSC